MEPDHPTHRGDSSNDDEGVEGEADVMGAKVLPDSQ
jgi:hypothetical protein